MTAKITNFKIIKSGVAGIKYLQTREYSNMPGLRGGSSRHKFTMILKKLTITQSYSTFSREQLMPIIQGKILEGLVINTDGWKAYEWLDFKWLYTSSSFSLS